MTITQRLIREAFSLGQSNPPGKETPHLILKKPTMEAQAAKMDETLRDLLRALERTKTTAEVQYYITAVKRYHR